MMSGQTEPFAGLWNRHRNLQLLRPIPATDGEEYHPARVIEVDIIVASTREWRCCAERCQAGWAVRDLGNGLIVAERTIG